MLRCYCKDAYIIFQLSNNLQIKMMKVSWDFFQQIRKNYLVLMQFLRNFLLKSRFLQSYWSCIKIGPFLKKSLTVFQELLLNVTCLTFSLVKFLCWRNSSLLLSVFFFKLFLNLVLVIIAPKTSLLIKGLWSGLKYNLAQCVQ